MPQYRTAPVASDRMPKGVPYIVGNEAAERFSFYGMRTILTVFMTKYLLDSHGNPAVMDEPEAKFWYHLFVSAAYFFPTLGALLSDIFLGKYRTIIVLSIVYCLGHLALALDETRLGLSIGLTMIAIGSGGIKPCVSAHVGDQFGATNQHLLSRVFTWFYFSINFGAFLSTLLTPWLLESEMIAPRWRANLAFGVPGLLMFLATWVFWLGRREFVHIPPGDVGFVREALSGEGWRAAAKLCAVYAFVTVFWGLYDQTGSAWVLQAEKMDRVIGLPWAASETASPDPEVSIGNAKASASSAATPGDIGRAAFEVAPTVKRSASFELLASQIQAVNPLLIMILVPVFSYGVYPAINRFFPLTPLRKISIGLFLTAASFVIPAMVEESITAGGRPHIVWQVVAYVVLTSAEVMVSITCLDFSYTQAPKKMKSFIMALYLLSVSAGNLWAALVNHLMIREDGSSRLSGADYYWFFVAAMFVAALVFVGVARLYREKTYLQDEVAS